MKFLFSSNPKELSHQQAYVFLIITVFLWAVGVVIARGVREEIPLIGLSFWRWTSAFLLILPFVFRKILNNKVEIKKHLRIYILQGMLMVGGSTLLFYSLTYTTAINATIINATQPVITIFLAWIILGHKHTRLQSVGVFIALLGIVMMVSRLNIDTILNLDFNIGDLLVITAMFGYGFYAVNISKMPHDLGAMVNLCMISLFGSLFVLPFYIAESIFVRPVIFNLQLIIIILVLSFISSIVSTRLWNTANAVVGPGKAAIFVNLMPVFGAMLAITFLSETLYFFHIVGTIMVCCGIFMVVKTKQEQ